MKLSLDVKASTRERAHVFLGIATYLAVYQWVYIFWLSPVYGYLGFAYNAPPIGYFLLSCGCAILPCFWMPLTITRPSQIVYWLLFITVYLPSLFVPLYAALVPLPDIAQLEIALFLGFAIIGLSYVRPLLTISKPTESRIIFWYGIMAITIGLSLWIVVVYYGHFRLVSFASVYEDLRFSGGALAEGTGVGYAVTWLSGAIFPFLMAWALFKRNWFLFVAGAAGELMLYTTAGAKATVLTVPFILLIYVLLRGKSAQFGLRLTWFVTVLLIGLSLFRVGAGDPEPPLLQTASSIVVMRSLSIPGLATAHYQRFFSTHPLTHYSHVKGINLLVEYPYQRSLGEEVGFDIYNSNEVDWNANFWATDGVAAFGLPGILLISIITGLLFWVLDSSANGHDPTFVAVISCYAAASIGNTSLFTSFVSGGLGFLVVLFFFMPKETEKDVRKRQRQSQSRLFRTPQLQKNLNL